MTSVEIFIDMIQNKFNINDDTLYPDIKYHH